MIQRHLSLLAVIGLAPAALNPSLAAAAAHIELALCGPAGGTVKIPTKTPSLPGSDGSIGQVHSRMEIAGVCCTRGERFPGRCHQSS